MSKNASLLLVVAAVLAIPLVFDPASVRPFVGPKVAVAVALGALAPVALACTPGLGRVRWPVWAVFGAHVAALAAATTLSLVPAVSVFGDYYRGMGLVTRLALVGLALVAAVLVAARREAAVVILRAVLAASAVCAAYTIVQALRLDPIFDPALLEQTSRAGVTELRAIGTLGHANFVGHLLLFGAGAAVALSFSEAKPWARATAAVAGALVAAGAIVSGSRGAWVGLAAEAVVCAAVAPRAFGRLAVTRRGVTVAAVVTLTALGLGVLLQGQAGGELSKRARAFRTDGMTGSGRTVLWRDALPMVGRYALHGCGPETFVLAFLPYESAELERLEPYALYDSAHSVPLDMAISTGLPGLATWLALLAVAGAALVRAFRAAPRGADRMLPLGLAVGLTGYVVGGLFVFDTVATAWYFYLFVALSVGLVANERVSPPPPWRTILAGVLLIAACAFVWPRLRLVWLADRQMRTALDRAGAGALVDAVGYGRAAVGNAEAFGPAPELRHLLARISARAGDPARPPSPDERALLESALTELDRARPQSISPQLLDGEAADLLLRFARTDDAVARLERAIATAPTFWPARVRLARILLETGNREAARREAAAALELNPESEEAKAVVSSQ